MSKKIIEGTVVGKSSDKTIKVVILLVSQHRVYGKFIRRYRKYIVHDSENKYGVGDIVKIQESVPVSSTKKWVVV